MHVVSLSSRVASAPHLPRRYMAVPMADGVKKQQQNGPGWGLAGLRVRNLAQDMGRRARGVSFIERRMGGGGGGDTTTATPNWATHQRTDSGGGTTFGIGSYIVERQAPSFGPFAIVTAVTKGYLEFFANWLAHIDMVDTKRRRRRTTSSSSSSSPSSPCPRLRDCVVAIAEDAEAFHALRLELGQSHVLRGEGMVGGGGVANKRNGQKGGHTYNSSRFNSLVSQRPRYVSRFLAAGTSVLYSDVDMVWLDDPIRHVNTIMAADSDVALLAQDDHWDTSHYGRGYLCSGLFVASAKPSHGVDRVMEHWSELMQGKDTVNQFAFNRAIDWAAEKAGVKVHILSRALFPSGNLFFGQETKTYHDGTRPRRPCVRARTARHVAVWVAWCTSAHPP